AVMWLGVAVTAAETVTSINTPKTSPHGGLTYPRKWTGTAPFGWAALVARMRGVVSVAPTPLLPCQLADPSVPADKAEADAGSAVAAASARAVSATVRRMDIVPPCSALS